MKKEKSSLMFLFGERVNLRILTEEDARILQEIVHSELARINTMQREPKTLEQEIGFIKNSVGGKYPTNLAFGIHHKEDDKLIGTMGIGGIDWISRAGTSGSLIGYQDYIGKGFGSEAKMLLLDYVFNVLNLRVIYSEVIEYNNRSNGSLQKCGYEEIYRIPKKHFRGGDYFDSIGYQCTRETFEKAKAALGKK
jgi:RimJ/RimL family protein N-acetyltransferase